MILLSMSERFSVQRRYDEAEPLFQRAIAMAESTLGAEHPLVARTLAGYAGLLRATKRKSEAAQLEQRAKAIASRQGQESAAGALTIDYSDLRKSMAHQETK